MINTIKLVLGIILTFTTTFFIFSGIATSATNQNNPLFDSVYNINTYNNPNAISGSNNIVNIGNGNNNNTNININTNTRGTGDRLEDYNITDNQLDEFLNNVDENGNLKGSANYNPLPVNNNSNVNNINNNNSNKNNPSPNINNNTTNTTRNNTTNNNSNINTANKRIDIINRYPCTALRWFLKYGYNNHEVRALQVFLFKEGYMTVLPNGNFGPATRAAVLAFQKENNIDTKGYVGPNTRARVALDTCNNVNAYSNNSGNNNSGNNNSGKNNSNSNNNSSNNGSANNNSNNNGSNSNSNNNNFNNSNNNSGNYNQNSNNFNNGNNNFNNNIDPNSNGSGNNYNNNYNGNYNSDYIDYNAKYNNDSNYIVNNTSAINNSGTNGNINYIPSALKANPAKFSLDIYDTQSVSISGWGGGKVTAEVAPGKDKFCKAVIYDKASTTVNVESTGIGECQVIVTREGFTLSGKIYPATSTTVIANGTTSNAIAFKLGYATIKYPLASKAKQLYICIDTTINTTGYPKSDLKDTIICNYKDKYNEYNIKDDNNNNKNKDNYEKLREIIVGDNYDAKYIEKDQNGAPLADKDKYWVVEIFKDDRWIDGGLVYIKEGDLDVQPKKYVITITDIDENKQITDITQDKGKK